MDKSQAHAIKHPQTSKDRGAFTVCVYCGSGQGTNAAYKDAATVLGTQLARQGLNLVYGGGGLGLMGAVAGAALKEGGHVTGIMPYFLSEKEKQLAGLSELMVVDNMHQRKMAMFEHSDAFVALPGGIGTLEELVEQLTWSQLGRHKKPIVLANIDGFWNPLLSLLNNMREKSFIREGMEVNVAVIDDAKKIIPTVQTLLETSTSNDPQRLDVLTKF